MLPFTCVLANLSDEIEEAETGGFPVGASQDCRGYVTPGGEWWCGFVDRCGRREGVGLCRAKLTVVTVSSDDVEGLACPRAGGLRASENKGG